MSSRDPYMKGREEGGNRERAAVGRGPAFDVFHFAVGVQPAKGLKKIEEVCFLCLGQIPFEYGALQLMTVIRVKVISDPGFAVSSVIV